MTNTITTGSNLTDQQWLNNAYLNTFGRSAVTGADNTGGAQYWLDQMAADPTGHSRDEVQRMLSGSSEGLAYNDPNTGGVVRPGGVNRGASTVSQADNEYLKSISGLGKNNADILNNIASKSFLANTDGSGAQTTDNVAGGYFQASDNDIINGGGGTGGGGGDNNTSTGGWWDQFADADAFKEFLQGDQTQSSTGGVDDFMKFMMFMSMMRPQGGMGGGSQYGYGGLNPGGVQSAYNPMDNITNMMSAFNSLPGIGTGTINTGTAAAA